MNFFQQLAALGDVDLSLRIMKKNDKLTINITPGSQSTITPVLVTGTPEELDEEFFNAVIPGVQELAGIISNIDAVKAEAEAKQKNAAVKPADKPKETAPKKEVPHKKKNPVPEVKEGQLFEEEEPAEVVAADGEQEETTEQ